MPFGIDFASVFWKNLVGVDLDPVLDIQEADNVTYNYMKQFEMV